MKVLFLMAVSVVCFACSFVFGWMPLGSQQVEITAAKTPVDLPEMVAIEKVDRFPLLSKPRISAGTVGSMASLDGKMIQVGELGLASRPVSLGIHVREPSTTLRKHLHLNPGMGLVVQNVRKESDASRAGIAVDDVLVSYNGQLLVNKEQLVTLVGNEKAGEKVQVGLICEGVKKTVELLITGPKFMEFPKNAKPLVPVLRTLKHPKILPTARCLDCHIQADDVAEKTSTKSGNGAAKKK